MAPDLVPAAGALLEQILDETHPRWGEGLSRAAYGRYNAAQLHTPWGAAHLRRTALVEGDTLLATAKQYALRARLDGEPIALLGIGAVFTPVACRGHGYAGELLRRMLATAADEGYGCALLFSEISPRYYERLGFLPLPVNQIVLDLQRFRQPGVPPIAMRSGDFGDLPAIVGMNAAQSDRYRFALVRDAEYVRHAITKKRLLAACGPPGHRKVEFFVVEEGGRAAAYAVLLEVGAHWMVTECGDRDPSGARVGAVLQALLAQAAPEVVHLRAWLPPGFLPPQAAVLAREIPAVTMMIRPLGRRVRSDPPLGPNDVAWWHADAF
jgi:GNAT superfamily N-acetyltransferase